MELFFVNIIVETSKEKSHIGEELCVVIAHQDTVVKTNSVVSGLFKSPFINRGGRSIYSIIVQCIIH